MIPECDNTCRPPVPCSEPMRYIQPEVAKSFKPIVVYQRSTAPIESETVYKNSFNPFPNMCRVAPVVPSPSIRLDRSTKMDDETVTQLSYPCPENAARAQPIRPCKNQLFSTGPLQDLTTQKHDYVAKPILKRHLIKPQGMMQLTPLPLDCETIQKLSFPAPHNAVRAVSFKPIVFYQRPSVPMDSETTQQLSFGPICTTARKIYPWAQKPCYTMPTVPIENETTYKLSYLAGKITRDPLVMPRNNPCMITCDVAFDDRTVYNESFLGSPAKCCRSEPIRPIPNLCMNTDVKMDPETMYSLAYPGHFCVPKQNPILPCVQPLRGGPMQHLTTQKHDFVCKPICVRQPIKPKNCMMATKLPLDCTTTANASYMCPGTTAPTVSFKPCRAYQRPCVPMDVETTQKLSFQPVCPPPKECYDWAFKPKYRMPSLPMDTETIQKLSYPPPGHFVSGGGDSCCIPFIGDQFPRAAVC